MKVPAFLLRRLYVKGSLRNVDGGFEFDLKNSLGSGYAESVRPIIVDDEALPTASTRFVVDGEVKPFESITADSPMTLGMNKLVTVGVDGRTLTPGKHKIGIGFLVTGMGELAFDVTDAIDDGA
jgi:hydroxymethylglutaryl-CoA reductase (NADPH)